MSQEGTKDKNHLEDKALKTAAQYFGSELLPIMGIPLKMVRTYVVCSSNVRNIRSELNEGDNKYRVNIVRMKDSNADEIIQALEEKQGKGLALEKREMVSLILIPLMSGTLEQGERIKKSLKVLQREYDTGYDEELKHMQAVLYAFAVKFLNRTELETIREVLTMTILGKMLMDEGEARGEDRMCTLVGKLAADNRMEDVKKIADDAEYRKKLFKEYGM